MSSPEQFHPLCDLHHVSMRHVMLEEDTDAVRSYHACERRDCTRIFRDGDGYTDWIQGRFDASRISARRCRACGHPLYLAEVDHLQKVETWECAETGCDFVERSSSPSAR